jgi:hypothetical protein
MKRTLFFMLAAGLSLASLSPLTAGQELTRAQAKELVEKKMSEGGITQITVPWTRGREPRGVGGPDLASARPCIPNATDVRVALGQFALCQGFLPAGVSWQHPGLVVTLKKPIRRTLREITGITGGQNPNEKIVEYSWEYDLSNLTKETQDDLKEEIQSGSSVFRLYDDGWRFVESK